MYSFQANFEYVYECVCGRGGGPACSLAMGAICLCRPLQQHNCITSVPEDFATPDNIGSRDQAQ